MGTCLVTSDNKNTQPQTQYSPTAIRAQIQANLAEKTLPQPSLKRSRQEGNEDQIPEKVKSVKVMFNSESVESQPIAESNCSLNVSESSDLNKRAMKQVVLPSLKELTYASSLHERTEKNFTSEEDNSEEQEAKSEEYPSNASVEEKQAETPFTREDLRDMRGLGATQTDNRLIELTVNTRSPLRLNSVSFLNGSVYSGEWLVGQRHGQGTLLWADGSRYDGEWRENHSWGFGRLAYGDREAYEGEFVRNCRHGKGRMTYGGSTYEGDWRNDLQQGRGVEKWNGGRYEGEWLAGRKNGYGEIYFEDGSFYKGEFNGNEIHGQGRYCWQGSRTYSGQWEHNRMSGDGVLIWNNGQRFQGKFRNDKLHGEGVIVNPDGSSSRGVFQFGKKSGHFIEADSDGKTREIDYFMGKRIKQAEEHVRSTTSNTFRSATQSV